MKKRLLALLLALAMMLSLVACTKTEPTETTAPTESTAETTAPTEPPEPTAEELYAEAVEGLKALNHVSLSYSTEESYTVWEDTYSATDKGSILFENLQAEAVIRTEGNLTVNQGISKSYTELFVGGKSYSLYDGVQAQDEVTQEEYLERVLPLVLFDAENFETAEVWKSESGYRLSFSGAKALEDWVAYEYAVLEEATAEMLIGAKGVESMLYSATFRQGGADISVSYSTKVEAKESATLEAVPPANATDYTVMPYSWIPQILTRVLSNYKSSNSLSMSSMSMVSSEAAAAYFLDFTEVHTHNLKSNPYFFMDSTINYYDSEGEETVEYSEKVIEGVLTTDYNGEVETAQVSGAALRPVVEDLFNAFLPEADYITAVEVVPVAAGEGMLLKMTLETEDAAKFYRRMACEELIGDANTLDDLATAYKTNKLTAYLGVDLNTLLPTSFGVDFEGVHTIQGYDCALIMQKYAKLIPSDPAAYSAVTDEPMEDAEPETPPTPLFYRVTGENGQEMWLLGTIHIGDDRTAYLPQEIYDAFDASDALAVEFNSNKHEEDMEEDEDYAEEMSKYYFYPNNSLTKNYLSEDVYEAAMDTLKYCGEYNLNMDYMKPFVWESAITNALYGDDRRLFSEKGVDNRLLARAEEQGKEILDVESAESQIAMLSGFSNELQEYLLKSILSASKSEYNEGVLELFNLWCEGDEEALKTYIRDEEAEETEEEEELTEEEKALQEEYEKAMQTDRDIDMVEVAKGYLESGKVIFYAVGLAHLLSEDGIVDSLRAAGYTVELVQFTK